MIPSFTIPFELTKGIAGFDIKVVSGSSFDIIVNVTRNEVVEDITGTTWTLKYSDRASTWSDTVAGSVTDAANGEVTFSIRADITATGNWVAAINAVSGGNTVYQIIGRLTVQKQVSGGAVAPTGTVFDWSAYDSFLATDTDGPVRAGTGITAATNDDGSLTFSVSSGGHTIQEEGSPLTQRTNLNFIGSAITAADDAGNDATTITVDVSDKLPLAGGTMTGTISAQNVVPKTTGAWSIGSLAFQWFASYIQSVFCNVVQSLSIGGGTLKSNNGTTCLTWGAGGGANVTTADGMTVTGALSASSLSLTTDLPVTEGGTGASDASGARTNLGLVIGTDVLAPDGSGANLTALNATQLTSGTVPVARLTSTINAQTGTGYTLVLADAQKEVTMTNASANVLTIPTNASVAFPTGSRITVTMGGAGVTSITGDTGVTVNGVSAGSGDIAAQYQSVDLLKIGTDTWIARGAIGEVT